MKKAANIILNREEEAMLMELGIAYEIKTRAGVFRRALREFYADFCERKKREDKKKDDH